MSIVSTYANEQVCPHPFMAKSRSVNLAFSGGYKFMMIEIHKREPYVWLYKSGEKKKLFTFLPLCVGYKQFYASGVLKSHTVNDYD